MVSGRAQTRPFKRKFKPTFLASILVILMSTLAPARSQEVHLRQAEGILGAGSCSAVACHGSSKPSMISRIRTDELTVWQSIDRHSDAFEVLENARSKTIIQRLGIGWSAATEEKRCLACHATVTSVPRSNEESAIVTDGVGCESCHGAAADWKGAHNQLDWPLIRDSGKTHFRNLRDLATRARNCAGCHVGEPATPDRPARDVDHALIAAGHPRLNFEFSAYLANMQKHWKEKTLPDALPAFKARAWALGQVVSSQAALRLLADRAARLVEGQANSWPEFAEYGCFSCHHDLRDDPWRKNRKTAPGSKAGGLDWGSWTYALLDTLGDSFASPAAKTSLLALDQLRETMHSASPDPATVAREAEAAARALDPWIAELANADLTAPRLEAIAKSIAAMNERGLIRDWDSAAQNYLAQVPLYHSIKKLEPSKIDNARDEEFKQIREYLKFPERFESPSGIDPTARKLKQP